MLLRTSPAHNEVEDHPHTDVGSKLRFDLGHDGEGLGVTAPSLGPDLLQPSHDPLGHSGVDIVDHLGRCPCGSHLSTGLLLLQPVEELGLAKVEHLHLDILLRQSSEIMLHVGHSGLL